MFRVTKKKIVVAVLAAFAFAGRDYLKSQDQALVDRFPHLDPVEIKRAHRQMLRNILRGRHTSAETNEDYDKIFLSYYHGYDGTSVIR